MGLAFAAGAAQAEPLRVCADPTNLPFSSNQASAPGFYLELAGAIGQALDRPVQPVWELTYYGKHATRETLLAGTCDMMVGVPADPGFMGKSLLRSQPFMQVGFALVTRGGRPTLAALHGKRVAVQLGTPPQSLLALHEDITTQTYLEPESAMQALANGHADAAFVWGPSAGYVNHTRLHDAFTVTPVSGEGMQYQVAVGFSRKGAALRDQVNQVLAGLGGTVAGLAVKYGFPQAAPHALAWAAPSAWPIDKAVFTGEGGAALPVNRQQKIIG